MTPSTSTARIGRLIDVRELPAVVGEGLVGLRHAVDVVLPLPGAALLLVRVEDLPGEAIGPRVLARGAGVLEEPADGEGAGATRGHLDRDLVGRAADAAGADLERRGQGFDRRLEGLARVFSAALADEGEGVVDDPLGKALLAVRHDLVDQLLDKAVAVTGVGLDRPDGGCGSARHYEAFTP